MTTITSKTTTITTPVFPMLNSKIGGGRYLLKSLLGQGSFADVYLAQDLSTNTNLAIKCLYKDGLDKSQIAIQYKEVEFMKRLQSHENIIHLTNDFQEENCLFLGLEYCTTDLFSIIESSSSSKTLQPFTIKKLFSQISNALSYSHSKGIYHRDIKPENILIKMDGDLETASVRLSDFGLATTEEYSDELQCGSVRYMSPECFESSEETSVYSTVDNDIWAMGILLFNMITSNSNPWNQPSVADFGFNNFINHGVEAFQSMYGFTDAAIEIFSRVFLPEDERCTLEELKEMVMNVEEFVDESLLLYDPVDNESDQVVPNNNTDITHFANVQDDSWWNEEEEMDYNQVPIFNDPVSMSSSSCATSITTNDDEKKVDEENSVFIGVPSPSVMESYSAVSEETLDEEIQSNAMDAITMTIEAAAKILWNWREETNDEQEPPSHCLLIKLLRANHHHLNGPMTPPCSPSPSQSHHQRFSFLFSSNVQSLF